MLDNDLDRDRRPDLELDKSSQQGFIAFFRSLPPSPSSASSSSSTSSMQSPTFRLFERNNGDFYSAHGDDAHTIALLVYKTTAPIKTLGTDLKSVTLSQATYRSFLALALFKLNARIEIYAPTEARKANSWQLSRVASPGNVQMVQDDLPESSAVGSDNGADASIEPVIVAVTVSEFGMPAGEYKVGLAMANATDKVLMATEVIDNDLLTTMESVLVQVGARECLVSRDTHSVGSATSTSGESASERILSVLNGLEIAVTACDKDYFRPMQQNHLKRLLAAPLAPGTLDAQPLALASLNALVQYLQLDNGSTANANQFTYIPLRTQGLMRLDAHALSALGLFGDGQRRTTHLYGLLNQCVTPPGSRLLAQWLRQPLADLDAINERHAIVQELTDSADLRDGARAFLKGVPDLPRLAKKLKRGKAGVADAVVVYQVAGNVHELVSILSQGESADHGQMDVGDDGDAEEQKIRRQLLTARFVEPLQSVQEHLSAIGELVEETVDLEAVENHQFRVLPHVDPELQTLHEQIADLESQVQPIAAKVARALGLELNKVVKVDHSSQHGFHLRVSLTHSNVLRGKKELIELTTLKSGVLFTTAELRRVAGQLLELGNEYTKQQDAVVKDLMAKLGSLSVNFFLYSCVAFSPMSFFLVEFIAEHIPTLTLLADVFSDLDVLSAFAHVGLQAPTPYTRPIMTHDTADSDDANSTRELNLINLRHPCIEVQPGMHFIPNDALMSRPQSAELLIITGPNTGGKSTYARSIALAAVLAQIGCFIPADPGSTLPVFDSVHCRIGAADNAAKGVSTFMAEMLETAAILRSATRASLVVIDELGRGTSTSDGFGLAYAIARHLVTQVRAFTLFATHFHEVTALADEVPGVKNLHVTACTADDLPEGMGMEMQVDGDERATPTKKRDITLLYKVEDGPTDKSFGIHVAELAGFPPTVVGMAKRKLGELERMAKKRGLGKRVRAHDEMQVDDDDVEAVQAKRAKQVVARFLREAQQLDKSGPEHVEQMRELKRRYHEEVLGNAWLKEVVEECTGKPLA
ncbi:muts domain V-domain-containing protein [Catenaria anguillulae PL171]|uniref:Muts domain V-domain-containing protein n=1 Tax=Catenaria anguillulae PL171 TaxID=765915 RepID=A0A1Y2HRT0_9FUNG|nr:muts domain V-domain-containing protein [Catenaria anguillulae PL171]